MMASYMSRLPSSSSVCGGVFVTILAFSLLQVTSTQGTFARSCDCEYMIDGKCAYTLLLPSGSSECPATDSGLYESLTASIGALESNIAALNTSTGKQAMYLNQLQNAIIQQQYLLNDIEASVSASTGCDECAGLQTQVDTQSSNIADLEESLGTQQTTVASLEGTVSATSEQLEGLALDVTSLSSNQSTLSASVDGLQGTVTDLQTELSAIKMHLSESGICATKGIIVSGTQDSIEDGSIQASGVFNDTFPATQARIFSESAWCAAEPNSADGEWLQLDLGVARRVYGFVTKGRYDYSQWVTVVQVSYTADADVTASTQWTYVPDVLGQPQTFEGNMDMDSQKTNMFFQPITAQYVRLHPLSAYQDSNKCMRADLIGCLDVIDT